MKKICPGFTLVELLVAMAILAILSTIALASFRSSQIRSRDAQRKSDLKQIANSLEMFINDYKRYPSSNAAGKIIACNYPVPAGTCEWGEGEFSDGTTIYFRKLPKDPSGFNYFYHTLNGNKSYQLYAHLENTEDKNCIGGTCVGGEPHAGVDCGDGVCNFAIFSSDVTATEDD